MTTSEPHVIVLGAGFAGAGAVRKLKDAPVRITIIDQNDYHTFQPLLYQLATNELDTTQVGFPVLSHAPPGQCRVPPGQG
ncbi:MAG: FAD-dependent oxidoreductase [Caldilineales bacterium]